MAVELDHVFILVSEGASEASALLELGLREGPPNVHPGQGTACRRFCFRNAYLELLWVCDALEAQSDAARPTHLWERWQDRQHGGCPFGVGFRASAQGTVDLPFPTWEYRPPYLPHSWCLHVGTNANALTEPFLFYMPFGRRPDSHPAQTFEHRIGVRELTDTALFHPCGTGLSPAFNQASTCGCLCLHPASSYLLEMKLDKGQQNMRADLRPRLPLVICW